MNINRSALGLAAALAATVLTGAAAIFGLSHRPAPVAAPAPATTVLQQAPASQQQWTEEGD